MAEGLHEPPLTRTAEIVALVGQASAAIRELSLGAALDLRLRKAQRIRTIQGSLAIEGNTLDTETITAIIGGQHVVAPLREVVEVRNAVAAYDAFSSFDPVSLEDLLRAHGLLMEGLADDAGCFRRGGVGVFSGGEVIHVAPPADRVPLLMADLHDWLRRTVDHPLIASSVFHYEFEFIHPFSDGNGRLGRLWQSVILAGWEPVLEFLPVESLIHDHQQEYYDAISASTRGADSAPFVEFMLRMILTAASQTPQVTPQVAPQVTDQVASLLAVVHGAMTRGELQAALGLSDRKSFRERYLVPALDAGLIAMTSPDAPTSRLQRYVLTPAGEALAARDHGQVP